MNDSRLTTTQRAGYKAPNCAKCGNATTPKWANDTRASDNEDMWSHEDECQRCRPCRSCGAPVRVTDRLGEASYAGTRHMQAVRRCTNHDCVMNGPVGNRTFGDAV